MTAPRKVYRQQILSEPHIVWNEFVHLLAMSNYHDLSETQRVAHLAFWYDSEVQNGGHLQYFENQGMERLDEVIASLTHLEAVCQADVLLRAAEQRTQIPRTKIQFAEEYVETALEGELDSFDREYHDCRPEITELLKEFLHSNQATFVTIVD